MGKRLFGAVAFVALGLGGLLWWTAADSAQREQREAIEQSEREAAKLREAKQREMDRELYGEKEAARRADERRRDRERAAMTAAELNRPR